MKILVIEDDPTVGQFVKRGLEQQRMSVDLVANGDEGEAMAAAGNYDLIILDMRLPGRSGLQVLHGLRARGNERPVLVLTAQDAIDAKVETLRAGADDYVTKPFSVRELMLRISALLKRLQTAGAEVGRIEFGSLSIDPQAHRAWVAEQEVELSALEFRLLLALYERKNRVQSRSSLLDDVWGVTADVTTRTVDTHVKRLRQKLGGAGEYVETLRGVGYRFKETPSGNNA